MADALPYEQLWRKIASESTGDEDDLGPLTPATTEFFRKEFDQIRRELGATFAEILSRESTFGRDQIHEAINTAISWKLWLRQPVSRIEAAYQGVYGLHAEVNNGGFHQFFFNSTGKYWPDVLWVMQEAGDTKGVERFTEVLSVFPNGQPAISRTDRWKQLQDLERWPWRKWKSRSHFHHHDNLFYEQPFPDRELFWQLVRERMPNVSIVWP